MYVNISSLPFGQTIGQIRRSTLWHQHLLTMRIIIMIIQHKHCQSTDNNNSNQFPILLITTTKPTWLILWFFRFLFVKLVLLVLPLIWMMIITTHCVILAGIIMVSSIQTYQTHINNKIFWIFSGTYKIKFGLYEPSS